MAEMHGIQKSVYEGLKDVLGMVRGGGYGTGDDFDYEALDGDITELLTGPVGP